MSESTVAEAPTAPVTDPEVTAPAPEAPVPPASAGNWKTLPAGTLRQVRVLTGNLGTPDHAYVVVDQVSPHGLYPAHEVKVAGDTRFVHDSDYEWCGRKGAAYVETTAEIHYRV